VSYGVVYAVAFLIELLPEENIVRRGFVEGAEAALDARKKAKASEKVTTPTKRTNAETKRSNARTNPRVRTSPKAKKAVEKRAEEFEAAAAGASSVCEAIHVSDRHAFLDNSLI
jgi:pyruvate/2-oxoglutarate dehydrogenase complex dihydrolipoamide acyltransferase (E2) component